MDGDVTDVANGRCGEHVVARKFDDFGHDDVDENVDDLHVDDDVGGGGIDDDVADNGDGLGNDHVDVAMMIDDV